MPQTFDRATILRAFDLLGTDLAQRGLFIELAIYGGSAIVLQFEWRRTTEDVDAVVRVGYDETSFNVSVGRIAERLGFDRDWLNNAVGMFTPLEESQALFDLCGTFPEGASPGLRVLLATPRYLLAMKLQALSNIDRGSRDLSDARHLARHLGIDAEAELLALYRSIHDEMPAADATLRFPEVLGRQKRI